MEPVTVGSLVPSSDEREGEMTAMVSGVTRAFTATPVTELLFVCPKVSVDKHKKSSKILKFMSLSIDFPIKLRKT